MRSVTTPKVLKNRPALIVQSIIALALSYAFASRAIDTGSYWQYLAALTFLVLTVKLLIRAIKK